MSSLADIENHYRAWEGTKGRREKDWLDRESDMSSLVRREMPKATGSPTSCARSRDCPDDRFQFRRLSSFEMHTDTAREQMVVSYILQLLSDQDLRKHL